MGAKRHLMLWSGWSQPWSRERASPGNAGSGRAVGKVHNEKWARRTRSEHTEVTPSAMQEVPYRGHVVRGDRRQAGASYIGERSLAYRRTGGASAPAAHGCSRLGVGRVCGW